MGRYLRRRFLVFLGGLAALSVAAYVAFTLLIAGQDRLTALINDLGRQRMVAMRIAATAMELPLLGTDEAKAVARAQLADDLATMEAALAELPARAKLAQAEDGLAPVLAGPPHHLSATFAEFRERVQALIDGHGGDWRSVEAVAGLAKGPLLDGLEALVGAVERDGTATVVAVRVVVAGGELLYLGLLVLMGVRLLWPLSRGVQDDVDHIMRLEGFQRSIVDALDDGLLLIDPVRGTARPLNPAARRIFGLPEDADLWLRDAIPALAATPVADVAGWTRHDLDGQHLDGTVMHLEATGRTIAGGSLVVMVRDVTEARENAARIRSFYDALEQSPVSIVITDASGVIDYVNPRCCEVTGYTAAEMIGQTPRLFKSGRTPPEMYRQLWTSLREGRQWRCEMLNRRKDGSLFWEFQAISPLRDARGRITQYMAVKEDITDQKEWQASMVQAMEETRRANQAKSDFLAGMSHELRTPLNAIIGYSELMLLQAIGPLGHPRYAEYLRAVLESGQHLLELINDLLDISKVEAGKLELDEDMVDLAPVVEEVMRLMHERAERGQVRVASTVAADFPQVYVDRLRIKQVLLNLMGNAIKFTPAGGGVTVSATITAEGGATLEVRDEGRGIPAEELDRVLEPFGQARDHGAFVTDEVGTGLGLPLSRRLAELHGGTLRLDSTPGQGTTVIVTLPPSRVFSDGGKSVAGAFL